MMAASPTISRSTVLNITIVVEAALLLLATLLAHLFHLQLLSLLAFNQKAMLIGLGAGAVTAASAYILLLLCTRTSVLPQLRQITDQILLPVVANLNLVDILIIAALSGFCEEVFFRGIIQGKCGLLLTSIAFGLSHSPSLRHFSYALLAFVYGLMLGALFDYTGNLWSPIIAHATHNSIVFLILRYGAKPPAATEAN